MLGLSALFDDSTRGTAMSYQALVQGFGTREDSTTGREEKNKLLSPLSRNGNSKGEPDEHLYLKALIEWIDLLASIAAQRERDSYANSRVLWHVVSAEPWYLNDE